MDDERLQEGMEWMVQQGWLDPATRDVPAAALRYLVQLRGLSD
jgi:hypothetical protein